LPCFTPKGFVELLELADDAIDAEEAPLLEAARPQAARRATKGIKNAFFIHESSLQLRLIEKRFRVRVFPLIE